MSQPRIAPAGDAAWIVEFDNRIDPAVNAQAIALARAVREARWSAVRDVVTGYRSVAVYVEPGPEGDHVPERLARLAARAAQAEPVDEPIVEVPVCYGGDYGPDLADVAAYAGCSEEAVVARHHGREYRVYMVGFVPGFPYMGTVDTTIAAPRRQTPRVKVPAGSVGIAGQQTGIYPRETPGGWNIIGRTPRRPFDENRPEPCLFRPGSRVRFVPIDSAAFEVWQD